MPPPAVADQASFAHVAEFFNSLLILLANFAEREQPVAADESVRATNSHIYKKNVEEDP